MKSDVVNKQKEAIIKKLRENGCRMTKQRMKILDIILEDRCSSCKEIYYRASESDSKIGIATVYRMVSALEDIGVVSRRLVYRSAGTGRSVPAKTESPAEKTAVRQGKRDPGKKEERSGRKKENDKNDKIYQ